MESRGVSWAIGFDIFWSGLFFLAGRLKGRVQASVETTERAEYATGREGKSGARSAVLDVCVLTKVQLSESGNAAIKGGTPVGRQVDLLIRDVSAEM